MIQKTKTINISSLDAFFRNIKATSDLYQAQAINFQATLLYHTSSVIYTKPGNT